MVLSIQITKFKFHQYQLRAISLYAKVIHYTEICVLAIVCKENIFWLQKFSIILAYCIMGNFGEAFNLAIWQI